MASKSKEELLELLESAPEARGGVKVEYRNNVIQFISQYNIIEGENSVPEKTLFRLYKAATKYSVKADEFARLFSEIFPRFKTPDGGYYKINLDAINVSQEILKITNEKKIDKTKNLQYVRTFERFTSKYGIEPGNNYIEGFVLYALFCKPYKRSGRNIPLGYRTFINFCRLYFQEKRVGSNRIVWFGIGKGITNHVTVEEIIKIRKRKKRNAEKKRRNKKKNRQEKSRIEAEQRKVQGIEARTELKK